MKLSWKVYLGSILVLCASLFIVYLGPDEFVRSVGSIPVAGSLITILFQLLRDEASYRHQIEMQHKEHVFNLGVTSHMAELAFSKHIDFAEQYIKEARSVFQRIFSEGPTDDLTLTHGLSEIRQKSEPWVPDDVSKYLINFENKIFQMQTNARFSNRIKDDSKRAAMIDQENKLFMELTGMEAPEGDGIGFQDKVTSFLKDLLGVNELTILRKKVIKNAIS